MYKSVSLSIGTLLLMFIEMGSMSNNILPLNKIIEKTARHKRQAMGGATKFDFIILKDRMKSLIDEYVRPTFPINIHVKLDPESQKSLEKLSKEFANVLRQTMTFPDPSDKTLMSIAEELDMIFIKFVGKFPNEEPFVNNIPGLLTFLQQMKPDANGELHFDQNNPKIKFIIHEILLQMEDLRKVDPFNPNLLRFIEQNQHLFIGFRTLDNVILDFDVKANIKGKVALQDIIDAMQILMQNKQMNLTTTFG